MTLSQHGLCELGYTCATREVTICDKNANLSQSLNTYRSSNCSLQLESMKLELLVIANHQVAVKLY